MANLSKKVYLSPSVMFAFVDRGNTKHEQAAAYFRFFSSNEYQLYVDVVDIAETYEMICKRMSPSVGKDFLRTIFLSDMNIIYPEEHEIKAALKTLITYRNDDLLYPEALRAILSNKRNISNVATFEFLHPLFGLQMFFLPI